MIHVSVHYRCSFMVFTWVCSSMFLSSCGDALSSLEGVKNAQLEQFTMSIVPDFARRGEIQNFTMTFDNAFIDRLAEQPAYLSEIRFGQGTSLRSFTMDGADSICAEVLISPLAEEGKRQPTLLFAADESELQVVGSFWVLPSLSQ